MQGARKRLQLQGVCRGTRGVSEADLQEVILNVPIEGPAQAHRVLLPELRHLQVEAELTPVVLQPQALRGFYLQEHGGQLLDMEHI